jgi:hypothetical protein
MGLFGIGNLLLKFKRKKIQDQRAKRNKGGYKGY